MTDVSARFIREVAQHEMTIAHDDGLYRHLKFRHTGNCYSGYYWFDLITVPGTLIFQGDGTSFVFSREEDMFGFFRMSAWRGRPNPTYWSEKLTCKRREDVKSYDQEIFEQKVKEAFVEAARYGGVPSGTGRALRDLVLDDREIYFEDGARQALEAFEHDGFRFSDTWEWSFRDYDWWFLWALEAILWGIGKYDEHHGRKSRWLPGAEVTVDLPDEPVDSPETETVTVRRRPVVTVELPGGAS